MKDTMYHDASTCDLEAFAALTSRSLAPADVPHAAEVIRNVPIYDAPTLRPAFEDAAARQALLAELAFVLGQSSGALVLKGAYQDTAPVDAATRVYETIIAEESAAGQSQGDHFAAAGKNARVWNSLQKLCVADPAVFADYFGNPAIAAVSEAWLGPHYQMTGQVNLVRPGGKAQTCHRDYHLGFQSAEVAAQFPAHAHDLSAVMTLQGAVAHCDMPVDSGPTKLLPFSQLYRPGYLAYRKPEFAAYFEDHHVQLPLAKGDALFFCPALFHAAGENRSSDVQRMANLLQVSSAFGRALEAVDRSRMCRALYPVLLAGGLDKAAQTAAIAACAEGYSFPTNLDSDPPIGGMVPETQAALITRALAEGLSMDDFDAALSAQDRRRQA